MMIERIDDVTFKCGSGIDGDNILAGKRRLASSPSLCLCSLSFYIFGRRCRAGIDAGFVALFAVTDFC